jgi:hypothetical protein
MIAVTIDFLVDKPVDEVFRRISDITGYRRWVPGESKFFIENRITSEGPFGVGTTYVDILKWRGRAIGEVITYTPPSHVAFRQTTYFGLPVFRATAEYILKGERNVTEITHRFLATPCGFFKLFEPLLSSIIRSERDRTCRSIKKALETG